MPDVWMAYGAAPGEPSTCCSSPTATPAPPRSRSRGGDAQDAPTAATGARLQPVSRRGRADLRGALRGARRCRAGGSTTCGRAARPTSPPCSRRARRTSSPASRTRCASRASRRPGTRSPGADLVHRRRRADRVGAPRSPAARADDEEPPQGLDEEGISYGAAAVRRAPARAARAAAAVGGQPQPPGPAGALALARDGQGRRRHAGVQPLLPHARWAVLDSGIDATHPAFARRDGDGALAEPRPARRRRSRVRATYDFTRLRDAARRGRRRDGRARRAATAATRRRRLLHRPRRRLGPAAAAARGPARTATTRRPRTSTARTSPASSPATGARTTTAGPADHAVQGVCPDMELYDLRVFDQNGAGDEFAILAALQFVRWLNSNASAPVIHGVNLSLSLDHEVGAYACGRTPVCDECERLLGSGTVVVAAAGNEGRAYYSMTLGHRRGLPPDLDHRPRQRRRRDHRRRDPPPPAPHLRRLVLLEPRPDRRRAPEARPRRARARRSPRRCRTSGSRASTARAWPRRTCSGAAALLMARHRELIG